MKYVIAVLIIILLAVSLDALRMRLQIHTINLQLDKRLKDGLHGLVRIPLIGRSSVELAALINKCISTEEEAKLALSREEKQFRSMIADISHDLRTPLTSIKGYVQLIEASRLDTLQKQRLDVIKRHADELGVLIEHFYEYSYLLASEPQVENERFSLTNELTECIAAAVPQLEERGMAFATGRFEQVFVLADREKTVRIIQNLIRNCLQHSAGDIFAEVFSHEDKVVLTVGNPIVDAESVDVSMLFNRFYTSDKSRRGSTGLGLSIVKLLAEQMGGNTSAEIRDGRIFITVTFVKSEK